MTYIVAEIGSNHDGDLKQAIRMIHEAARCGADAVKFQCLPDLPQTWMRELKEAAKHNNVDMFATPFDVDAVRRLAKLGVPYIKIASPEIVNHELLAAAGATEIPLLLSTGMASIREIDEALITCHGYATGATLMQCTSRYPTPVEHANLHAISTLRSAFQLPVGFSDHTESAVIPAAAVALGATVIEKHFTFDRLGCGPDHLFALEPWAFAHMVDCIREVEQGLGNGWKRGPVEGEAVEARGRDLSWT